MCDAARCSVDSAAVVISCIRCPSFQFGAQIGLFSIFNAPDIAQNLASLQNLKQTRNILSQQEVTTF